MQIISGIIDIHKSKKIATQIWGGRYDAWMNILHSTKDDDNTSYILWNKAKILFSSTTSIKVQFCMVSMTVMVRKNVLVN